MQKFDPVAILTRPKNSINGCRHMFRSKENNYFFKKIEIEELFTNLSMLLETGKSSLENGYVFNEKESRHISEGVVNKMIEAFPLGTASSWEIPLLSAYSSESLQTGDIFKKNGELRLGGINSSYEQLVRKFGYSTQKIILSMILYRHFSGLVSGCLYPTFWGPWIDYGLNFDLRVGVAFTSINSGESEETTKILADSYAEDNPWWTRREKMLEALKEKNFCIVKGGFFTNHGWGADKAELETPIGPVKAPTIATSTTNERPIVHALSSIGLLKKGKSFKNLESEGFNNKELCAALIQGSFAQK